MDLNHRSSGHEPDEITKLLHSATGIPRLELGSRQSKCLVIPLHHIPMSILNQARLPLTIIPKIVCSATQLISLSFEERPLTSYQSLKDQNLRHDQYMQRQPAFQTCKRMLPLIFFSCFIWQNWLERRTDDFSYTLSFKQLHIKLHYLAFHLLHTCHSMHWNGLFSTGASIVVAKSFVH